MPTSTATAGQTSWRHTSGAVHVGLIDGTAISGRGTPGTVDLSWVSQ